MHTATVTMILTGPFEGQTKTLNGYLFNQGRCTVSGSPGQLSGLVKYFKASYEVALDDAPAIEQPTDRAAVIIGAALKIPYAQWDHKNTADGLGSLPKIADMAPLVGRYDLTRQEMAGVFSQWSHLIAEHVGVGNPTEGEKEQE